MPTMIRWFVKSSILCFVGALLVGLWIEVQVVFELPIRIPSLTPVFYHLLMVGWVTQMIFGVSIWMFPSHPSGDRFGNESLVWTIFFALNTGLFLRVIGEPIASLSAGSGFWGFLLALSALLQWGAALMYLFTIWPRVKGK